jgi:phosphoribosylformylglycinamidine synthase, purS protein
MPTNRETSRVRVTVLIRIRDGVLDPQGEAVKQALKDMGHSSVEDVRIGKIVEVILPSAGSSRARQGMVRATSGQSGCRAL